VVANFKANDEELAMPMTAAPTNKGASEIGPLESSYSGTAPPSSKKACTTSLSTAIKKISVEVKQ
jgi:hypothetical protein